MTASLHTEALAWLRYGKRMPIVCTEAGSWNADVIGMSSELCIEVEVKKSISDLRADFKNKTAKHYVYNNASGFDPRNASGYVPNYMYYFVPYALAEKAEEVIQEKAPKAGLAALKHSGGKHQGIVEIVKRPSKLHDRKPSHSFVRAAVMRMASEICIAHLTIDSWKEGDRVPDIVKYAAAMEGTLDFEFPEAVLVERGQLLMHSLGGDWEKADFVERVKYIFAAQTFLTSRTQNVPTPTVIT